MRAMGEHSCSRNAAVFEAFSPDICDLDSTGTKAFTSAAGDQPDMTTQHLHHQCHDDITDLS